MSWEHEGCEDYVQPSSNEGKALDWGSDSFGIDTSCVSEVQEGEVGGPLCSCNLLSDAWQQIV